MARKTRTVTGARPQVALLVETSMASGRQILRGISRYAREYGPWALYYEPGHLQRVLDACRSAGVSVPEAAAVLGVDSDESRPGHQRLKETRSGQARPKLSG